MAKIVPIRLGRVLGRSSAALLLEAVAESPDKAFFLFEIILGPKETRNQV